METQAIVELFPLFSVANPETLEWILSVIDEESYEQNEEIIKENDWGKAVHFIVSGWVKVRSHYNNQQTVLEILGKGDFFGEMEVLDESLKYVDVIALSDVQLLSISAQRFLQMLFKDPQVHHKILQLSVRRFRHLYRRFQLYQQTSKIKLIKTLIKLAENYGKSIEEGAEILQIPHQDLADVADISLDECEQIITQLKHQGCLESDPSRQLLFLTNLKQLNHFAKQI
ncbi:Crp/Fnr family transcriptional regulator [Crocosphaera watsonii WH 8501]|uniref:Cyclic nucleotide-binding n=1 Tax=Crocosphaera watsonii WH 8501 TaxID=165597 RepID=Q4C924_CROWT|nr:Crp/Fnr family transcriptional regulator [Crocosphaera watsonii]EAM52097.1 Cyclic nucleotide-binding [Crocosphaera watsonii WH 8501]